MEFQHELIIPNEGLPFKVFLFEGGNGNYVREEQHVGVCSDVHAGRQTLGNGTFVVTSSHDVEMGRELVAELLDFLAALDHFIGDAEKGRFHRAVAHENVLAHVGSCVAPDIYAVGRDKG